MTAKMIWFDFGGVLSPPIQTLYDIYESRTGLARDHIESAMAEVARPLGVHPLAPIELALMTQRDWGSRMREALTRLYPSLDTSRCEFETHGDQWFADIPPNTEMINLFREVKQRGHKVGILTNNVVEWEGPWRAMVGLDGVADAIVDSCKVGARKPERRIFDIAAKLACSTLTENILIDDVPENCAAAQQLGWNAILFETNEQTRRDLLGSLEPARAAI
jgi:putative hydrolase of the HAD superfamily